LPLLQKLVLNRLCFSHQLVSAAFSATAKGLASISEKQCRFLKGSSCSQQLTML